MNSKKISNFPQNSSYSIPNYRQKLITNSMSDLNIINNCDLIIPQNNFSQSMKMNTISSGFNPFNSTPSKIIPTHQKSNNMLYSPKRKAKKQCIFKKASNEINNQSPKIKKI